MTPHTDIPLHIRTSVQQHRKLSRGLNKAVNLKMENQQPSGSFKMRGIGLLCQRSAAAGARGFICASGGNAGFAAAVCGRELGIPTTIVVPTTVSASVIEAIRALDANVEVVGQVWDETHQYALQQCQAQSGLTYIHPFDHPDIWDGHASMIDELTDIDFDVVICSVGGGGLLSGVIQGLRRNFSYEIPVIAVETQGAASLHEAIKAKQLVELASIQSIATTLGARKVSARVLEDALSYPVTSVLVSDADAVDSCIQFANDLRVLVEPACGAALALGYHHAHWLEKYHKPLFIVCGGIGVDLDKLRQWQAQFR